MREELRTGLEATIRRRLARDAVTATVSYTRDDGMAAVCVGSGDSLAARVADADAQLPPGLWTRDAVSTPTSVYADLTGRVPRDPWNSGYYEINIAYPMYERKVVQR